MSLPGMLPNHPFYPYAAGGAGQPHPMSVLTGSAFHSPGGAAAAAAAADNLQAVKMAQAQAQMHNIQLDWLVRTGMGVGGYVPRMVDYNGEHLVCSRI